MSEERCAFCEYEATNEHDLLAHAKKEHPEKLRRPEPLPAEPPKCGRCNMPIVGKPWCNCHCCDVPLCGITCEEWHLERDCKGCPSVPSPSEPNNPAIRYGYVEPDDEPPVDLKEEALLLYLNEWQDEVDFLYGDGTLNAHKVAEFAAAFAAHLGKR